MTALLVLASYLVGAIPFSLLVARLRGVELRAVGSGNIGAANVWRSCGFGPFVAAVVLDTLKGAALPLLASQWLLLAPPAVVLIGLAAVLGHTFPIYLGFRGGKAVATSGGVLLAVAPLLVLLGVVVWAVAFALSRVSSVASLSTTAAVWLAAMVQVAWSTLAPSYGLFVTVAAVVVVVLHRDNIRRLAAGNERRFSFPAEK